jgi:hypothetical protein
VLFQSVVLSVSIVEVPLSHALRSEAKLYTADSRNYEAQSELQVGRFINKDCPYEYTGITELAETSVNVPGTAHTFKG